MYKVTDVFHNLLNPHSPDLSKWKGYNGQREKKVAVGSADAGAWLPGFRSQLCNPGQVTECLCLSSTTIMVLVVRTKSVVYKLNIKYLEQYLTNGKRLVLTIIMV